MSHVTLGCRHRKWQSSVHRPPEPTRGTCQDYSRASRLPRPSVAVNPLRYDSLLTIAFIVQCDYSPSPVILVQRLDDPLCGLVQRLSKILHAVCQRGRRVLTNEILVEEKHQ